MADQRYGDVLQGVKTLFNVGVVGGLTDGELLARFANGHGESAEGAFATLVERHGPEGQTCATTARQLGWPVGTVKSRLARGRERLRGRLVRRGIMSTVVIPILESPPRGLSDLIPRALANSTIRDAKPFATTKASAALSGLSSPPVAALMEGVLRTMLFTKLKITVLGLLSAGIVATSVGILSGQEPATGPAGIQVPSRDPERPIGGVLEKPRRDLVTDEIQVVRGQLKLLSASEQELGRELGDVRAELKVSQSHLKDLQAQAKPTAEIERVKMEVANLQSDVLRQEALLESVQKEVARVRAELTPGDIVTIAVSRSRLREMLDRLVKMRDLMGLDVRKRERDYLDLRSRAVERGEPEEQSLRDELKKSRDIFNGLVDQLKFLQFLYDRTASRVGD